jgi:hypothetical protein
MKLKNIVWTAVATAGAGIAALLVAILGNHEDVVIALAGIAVASAILSSREN